MKKIVRIAMITLTAISMTVAIAGCKKEEPTIPNLPTTPKVPTAPKVPEAPKDHPAH